MGYTFHKAGIKRNEEEEQYLSWSGGGVSKQGKFMETKGQNVFRDSIEVLGISDAERDSRGYWDGKKELGSLDCACDCSLTCIGAWCRYECFSRRSSLRHSACTDGIFAVKGRSW